MRRFVCPNCKSDIDVLDENISKIVCKNCGKEYDDYSIIKVADISENDFDKDIYERNEKQFYEVTTNNRGNLNMFVGTVREYLFLKLINSLLCVITLGVYYPWAICREISWEIEQQNIDGYSFEFNGNGWELLKKMSKWGILIFITFGIYSFWVPVKFCQWKTENTHVYEIKIKPII